MMSQLDSKWFNFELDLARTLWAILPATLLWGASFPLALSAAAQPGDDPAPLLLDVREDDVQMGHEATVSKVSDDQLFYLMSRGMSEEEAMAMIVRGFVEPIAKELPMEYALELNRLIELQMEGAVG